MITSSSKLRPVQYWLNDSTINNHFGNYQINVKSLDCFSTGFLKKQSDVIYHELQHSHSVSLSLRQSLSVMHKNQLHINGWRVFCCRFLLLA
jgi:hypothetical protein